jgi:glyoxylate reductase
MKYKIVVVGKLPEDLLDVLRTAGDVESLERNGQFSFDEIIAAASSAHILLTEPYVPVKKELLAACPDLFMVAQRAVGFDNISLPDCNASGVIATNTPGVLDNATADLAFTLLLATARRIVEADNYVRDGHWQGFENDLMLGSDISGQTLGIIGMGRIGSAMARRARGFDMNVIYCRSKNHSAESIDKQDQDKDQKTVSYKQVDFDTLLAQSDYISLHCPHNKETEKLIGEREFALMKPNCILVNTARGKVVDEEALCRALESKKIAGAGLDVFYDEPTVSQYLLKAPNVVLAPHIGSATAATRHAMAHLAVDSVLAVLAQKLPSNALNKDIFPQVLSKIKQNG